MAFNRRKFINIAALGSGAMALTGNLFARDRNNNHFETLPSKIIDGNGTQNMKA